MNIIIRHYSYEDKVKHLTNIVKSHINLINKICKNDNYSEEYLLRISYNIFNKAIHINQCIEVLDKNIAIEYRKSLTELFYRTNNVIYSEIETVCKYIDSLDKDKDNLENLTKEELISIIRNKENKD